MATDLPRADRTAMICYLIAVLSVFGSFAADAAVADLQALKSARRELTVRLDSLAPQRAAIEAELCTLSTVIDSLKRSAPESEQLNEVYVSLNAPMEKVSGIDSEMEKISARRVSVTDALRAAYDWEISTLFKSLSEEPDEGLLQQLIIFQDERRALGEHIVASRMRYAEDMVVNEADGPDQIRQKIQFLEGKKGLLQSEVRRVEARIKRLEAERRLAKGMSGLAEKMWALERRHLFKGRSAFKTRARAGEMAPAVPAATTSQGAPQTRAKGDSGPISNYIALEIRKLYARQEELGQIVAVLEERVGTFRLHLRELLDGRE